MKLILLPNTVKSRAQTIINHFEKTGSDVYLEDMFVLDEILKNATPKIKKSLKIHSGKRVYDVKMVERLRFDRGLDISPLK